jgi:hypothetical protein
LRHRDARHMELVNDINEQIATGSAAYIVG